MILHLLSFPSLLLFFYRASIVRMDVLWRNNLIKPLMSFQTSMTFKIFAALFHAIKTYILPWVVNLKKRQKSGLWFLKNTLWHKWLKFKGAISRIQKLLLLATLVAFKWTAARNLFACACSCVHATTEAKCDSVPRYTHKKVIFWSFFSEVKYVINTVNKHPDAIHAPESDF